MILTMSRIAVAMRQHRQEFKRIFGVPIENYRDYAGSMFIGFDIVRFDEEFLATPDDVSTIEFIQKKYGDRAVQIINELCG